MGAKKWREHYNESLKGKHVVLIPDNDNEGRQHMAQAGASLNGIAASLKWIDLPDLPSKGDFSDWLVKFTDKEAAAERLAVMIDQADEYTPPKQASIEDAVLKDIELTTLEIPIKQQIVVPWLTEQSIVLLSGWRGTGKTWLAMGLCDAITRGVAFGPWEVGLSVPCLYLDGEMPAQDFHERVKLLNPDLKRKQPLYLYSDAYANHLGLPRANLLSATWRDKMRSILTTREVKVWVADNLASLAGGIDESKKADYDPINQWLLELRFAGITTILAHHTGKGGDQRGTSAREDNIDASIILKAPHDYTPEDGARFIVRFTKSRVELKHLPLVADTQFQLTEDEAGLLTWTWGSIKRETKIEILKLMDEGQKQIDVASILGLSRGYVSKVVKSATREGLLTAKGICPNRV
jgi:putative DNA primase/helicase